MKKLQVPFENKNIILDLKQGDQLLISGTIYTARDAAHKRLVKLISEGKELPFDIKDQIIYYMGPCPAKPGEVIGSAGPTTSKRMNRFAPVLLHYGLKGIIGKGPMSDEVYDAIKEVKGIYFTAVGGAGAYYADKIKSKELVCFEDLGPEAVYKLEVENFPVIVQHT